MEESNPRNHLDAIAGDGFRILENVFSLERVRRVRLWILWTGWAKRALHHPW